MKWLFDLWQGERGGTTSVTTGLSYRIFVISYPFEFIKTKVQKGSPWKKKKP